MDRTTDLAGAGFSALVIIAWIPLAIFLLRQRGTLGRERIITGATTTAAALFNGLVNVLRYTGRLPDNATYQTLNTASWLLYVIMMALFIRAQIKSYPVA